MWPFMFLYFQVSWREMYYLGVEDESLVLFFLFCLFYEFANCKGGSIKTHLVNNKLFSKSHQSLLLDDIQRYETSTEMEKENASLKGLDLS